MKRVAAILGAAFAVVLFGCDKATEGAIQPADDKSVVAPNESRLDSSLAVIFPESRALELVRQCGRPPPLGIESVWTPALIQSAFLEARLSKLIAEKLAISVGGRGGLVPRDYYRQYAGLVIDGRRVIYVNGFHKSIADTYPSDWRQSPVIACDGGKMFFGVEYDVQSEAFVSFTFNGLG